MKRARLNMLQRLVVIDSSSRTERRFPPDGDAAYVIVTVT
jgi:hypothetical protein